jgi:hypothetical protein
MEMNQLGIWRSMGDVLDERDGERASVRASSPRASVPSRSRAFAGGRVTVDHPGDNLLAAASFISPLSTDPLWRGADLSPKALSRVPPARLLELLADNSPDVSRALWDTLIMWNPGYDFRCYKPGGPGAKKVEDARARQAITDFLKNLHGPYAAPNVVPANVVIASLFMGYFLRGAMCAELVLDPEGRVPLEIATPDPALIGFTRVADDARGAAWQLGQWQQFKFVAFERPTVVYVPLHPFPGQPRGRAMATPALFSTLFTLGLLHDLRRVISQQGYPRPDIAIKFEEVMKLLPEEDRDDPAKVEAFLKAVVKQIEDSYEHLQPDDAYVHIDYIEHGKPVGTGDRNSLGGIGDMITALERLSVRALKTLPLLMGINEATSETHANRQWEVYAAHAKSIQHDCEFVMERLLDLALQAQGVAATVEFRFAELRAAERLRDAQSEAGEIANEARKRDEGWQTNDEASQKIVGHAAVAEPTRAQTPPAPGVAGINADPGSQRDVRAVELWNQYKRETAFVDGDGETVFSIPYGEWWNIRYGPAGSEALRQ